MAIQASSEHGRNFWMLLETYFKELIHLPVGF
jgi:hypothetical protein